MKPILRRARLWLITLVLILAACTTAGGESSTGTEAGTAAAPAERATPTTTVKSTETTAPDSTETTAPLPTETTAPATTSPNGEQEILTEDNRPTRLRNLTASWNTNWNKRIVEYDEILSGGPPRDGIPSIDAPTFESIDAAAEWLADNEPVLVVEINDDARAYPLSIMTWHEIVNDVVGGEPVVVTFCPLCNSAIVFDRRVGDQTFEFGVSGLLRNSDLIMYDRTTETLWQQFTGEAIIGDLTGEQLTFLPSSLVSFADFRAAHPDGKVLSRNTGFDRPYGRNPYAGYDTYENPLSAGGNLALFEGEADSRLEPAARVVTVSLPDAGVDVAYPLDTLAEVGVINDTQEGQSMVVFHQPGTSSALGAVTIADGADVGATGVFDPTRNGETLTFSKEGDRIVDDQTGSTWNIFGEAVAGELSGERLSPIVHGNHFWFSWAAFRPDTIIYQAS